MNFKSYRAVDPEQRFEGILDLNEVDFEILKLSKAQFYTLFGPEWDRLSVSDQLLFLADLAAVLEGQATQLNLSAAPPVLK